MILQHELEDVLRPYLRLPITEANEFAIISTAKLVMRKHIGISESQFEISWQNSVLVIKMYIRP